MGSEDWAGITRNTIYPYIYVNELTLLTNNIFGRQNT